MIRHILNGNYTLDHWLQKWKEYAQAFLVQSSMQLERNGNCEYIQMDTVPKGVQRYLYIYCTDIKSDETTIYCSHFIQIESMNYCQTHFDGNPIIEDYSVTFVTCTSPFKWNDLQNESEMTICVKIWKTGAIEKNEARLVSTIYSDKIKKKK
eukprot:203698_1